MTTLDMRAPMEGPGRTSATDMLLGRAADFAARRGTRRELPAAPLTKVAVLACMDARIDVHALLGLAEGDAHVVRNAGGVVTDDVIRSLAVSQHELGTREIIIIKHTGCGMQMITDEGFRSKLERRTGTRPDFAVHAFTDVEDAVRASIGRLRSSPFLPDTRSVRGFVYDVASGCLAEILP
jgi:carbonic anhydrase